MNVEEALKDAMAARVSGVEAPPSMAQAVRRRNRRHVVRFRTAGMAALTAAVAGAVPFALHAGTAAPLAGAQPTEQVADAPTGVTSAMPGIIVPDVVGMDLKRAMLLLRDAGLDTKIIQRQSDRRPDGKVVGMDPAAGTVVGEKEKVGLVVLVNPAAEPTQQVAMPQDLGDLGDGRTFGGMHLGYLPAGLEWGHWSGKNGFGTKSYTTTFVEPGLDPGMYSVQVVVFTGEAAANAPKKGDLVAENTYLASLGEGGEVSSDPSATRTITRFLRRDFAVEIMVSPDFGGKLASADRELKKMAAGVTLVK
jgi:hypothetical protein